MNVTRIDLDLAKNLFELYAADENEQVVLRKTAGRSKLRSPRASSRTACCAPRSLRLLAEDGELSVTATGENWATLDMIGALADWRRRASEPAQRRCRARVENVDLLGQVALNAPEKNQRIPHADATLCSGPSPCARQWP
jgi:hypothetical protein